MINVKDQVYAALLEKLNNVSDSYPKLQRYYYPSNHH